VPQSSYVGHRKNKGVVLREQQENLEKAKGEEALTVAQDDADPRRWRRAEAADESVGDAGSRRGG